MRAFYTDEFVLPLPQGHRFPMAKYRRLRERIAGELPQVRLSEPPAAGDDDLLLAHDPAYVRRVSGGLLDAAEVRAIGFPWSPQMVERSRRSTGASLAACRAALAEGCAVNLAGGTHHAHRDRGAGYCVFNDAAVAARRMQRDMAARGSGRPLVAIVDLDVHQGDGTASICDGDDSIVTLSLHGAGNFPFRKVASDIDIALPDGTGDGPYLAALDAALDELARRAAPALLIYLAGADAHRDDRLGRLDLSTAGMRQRDERVFAFARSIGAPIAVAMAGGYGIDIDVTVDVHFGTVRAALEHWRTCNGRAARESGVA